MKRFKFSSFILASAMFLSTVSYISVPVYAGDEPRSTDPSDNGMVISKTATANPDGTYKITLEAYATGEKIISEVTKDVPTDIVLVLDQSGSMSEDMKIYAFKEYEAKSNNDYFALRHNGGTENLYYQLEDGGYASVSINIEYYEASFTLLDKPRNDTDWGWFYTNLYDNSNNLYIKSSTSDTWYKIYITKTQSGKGPNKTYTYNYYLKDGTLLTTSQGKEATPSLPVEYDQNFYTATYDENQSLYNYYYYDSNGKSHPIESSTGINSTPECTLYQKYESGNTTKLQALKDAVTTFADNVTTKAKGTDGIYGTDDDINHRIAIVGFATGDYTGDSNNYPKYENTELFIGSSQYNYNVNASSYYSSSFQSMNTQTGYNNVLASKEALAARGATYINYGIEMANKIFEANPIPADETRNQVIIVFTDGIPGYSSYDSSVASSAISKSQTAKSKGVTVYSVGIFDGADATSAGNSNGTDTQKANYFMQKLSSNNGAVQNPSYYLSAADADTLTNIFKQISDQIESGGSSTTLGAETVVKDIISPQFKLPDGATSSDITLETYECTGMSDGKYTWAKNITAMGAKAEVNGGQVNVSGFDFSENYVGTDTKNGNTTYRGNKLVISFTVSPKAGFLGGNNVYTNASAGVYESSTSIKPVMEFNRPQVNVPIGKVDVRPSDKNIYVLSDLTLNQLKNGTTVNCGGIELDLSKSNENYGLDAWQTDYVDISVVVKDKGGNEITSDLSDLTEDQVYSIQVTVSPKDKDSVTTEGEVAVEKSDIKNPKINVFKPVVTLQDRAVFYGDIAPSDYTANTVNTAWKHGNVTDAEVTMIGSVPSLDLTFTPETGKIVNNSINTKQDIGVHVTASIGDHVLSSDDDMISYEHKDCTDLGTEDNPEELSGYQFWLHVKTGKLTIVKNGGTDGEHYLFEVYKKEGDDFVKYTETSITCKADADSDSVTIYELPVGLYQVKELTQWSWRDKWEATEYVTYDESNNAASITSENSSAKATITNERTFEYWLNGFSDVVRNVFGQSHN